MDKCPVSPPSQGTSFFPFPMTISKPNKHSVQAARVTHSHASASTSARKSSRVPRPSFKVVDSLYSPPSSKPFSRPSLKAAHSFTSRSSSPSRPPLRAADSIASLTSSSSRPALNASNSLVSLASSSPPSPHSESRASSPVSESRTHISVSDSEVEVDPQVELGTRVLIPLSLY